MSEIIKKVKVFLFLLIFFLSANTYCFDRSKINFNFTGNVNIDHVFRHGVFNDEFYSGSFFRHMELIFNDRYGDCLSYFVNLNLLYHNCKDRIVEAYLKLEEGPVFFRFGQLKAPYNLEKFTPIYNRLFMESSLLEGVHEESFIGFMTGFKTKIYNLSYWMFFPGLKYNVNKSVSNKYSYVIRGFMHPIPKRFYFFICHFGVNYKLIRMNPNNQKYSSSAKFRDVPAFVTYDPLLTSQLTALPKYISMGFEGAISFGPLFFQSEYSKIKALWRDFNNELYKSWYVQGSVLLTTDFRTYNYDSGTFYYNKPRFFIGSLEFAFRYSYNDLRNKGALLRGVNCHDGNKKSIYYGVNWLLNNKVRVQINSSKEYFEYRLKKDRLIRGFGLRVQFLF